MIGIEYKRRLEKIEEVLCKALPEQPDSDWMRSVFSVLPEGADPAYAARLLEPCRNLLLLGGKRWRPLLLVLSCELAGSAPEAAYPLVPAVEFAHTASLIHDDIEDCAEERRGKPCAHLAYGTDTAINSASWLYFHAQTCIAAYEAAPGLKLRLFSILNRELRRLHLGQAMDIQWHRDHSFIPSREQYECMVRLKTGTLACLAAETGSAAGGAEEEEIRWLGKIASDAGAAFQILDDVKNLTQGNPGKQRGDDIVEGKKSLPVVLHEERGGEDLRPLFEQARKEGIRSPAVEQAIAALERSGAIRQAAEYGNAMAEACITETQKRWNGNPAAGLIAGLFRTMLSG